MSLRERDHAQAHTGGARAATSARAGATPGKQTLVQASRDDSASNGGLPPATRAHMEAAFSADFSDVRVHEGGHAGAVGARAYAQGSELHFAPGQYRPGTPEGDRLIGHELTHVLQQRDGRVPGAQRKPIQRQGDAKGSSPTPVYQYTTGTTHLNDCGPASLLVLLHMIAPDHEANLTPWILAHRPKAPALAGYLTAYKGESTEGLVSLQEKLDVVRDCATIGIPAAPLGAVIYGQDKKKKENANKVKDDTLSITQVKAGVSQLLTLVGASVPDDKVNALLSYGSDSDDLKTDGKKIGATNIDEPANHAKVIKYLKDQCTGDQVIVALGVPQEATLNPTTKRTEYQATGWGWGGTADPKKPYTPPGRDVGPDTGGHFVIVHSYNAGSDEFTIIDPSFLTPQVAKPEQLIGFLRATGGSIINLLVVPVGQVKALVPALPATPGAAPATTPAATGATPAAHTATIAQASGATAGHPGVVDDPALEAEADRMGDRAASGSPAHASIGAAPAGAVQRQTGTPTPLAIPAGPIPVTMLQGLPTAPQQAVTVAEWCKVNLLHKDEMQAFWAANPNTRGATLGQMAVQLGRLEFMLGWIQQGGLSTQTTAGWEDQGTAADNHSKVDGDTSSNKGTFPGRYQAPFNGGKGMAGYDWCGMFLGYLYNDLLKLDDGGMGGDGLEGWRGADTLLASGNPKIWPSRVTDQNSDKFGTFTGWDGGVPRAGDLAIISHAAFTPGLGAGAADTRTPDHVGMVEEVATSATTGYVRTIDGNSSLLASSHVAGSDGSHAANAVSGRAYNLGSPDKLVDGSYAAYFNNQSRMIAIVRMTDRASNFSAPAAGAAAPSGADLLARLASANAQIQAVLNAQPGTSAPYDATGSVRGWIKKFDK
jgi:hypothetical protein